MGIPSCTEKHRITMLTRRPPFEALDIVGDRYFRERAGSKLVHRAIRGGECEPLCGNSSPEQPKRKTVTVTARALVLMQASSD